MSTDKNKNSIKDIWIGLVAVKPKPGCELLAENIKGAYVNILAWARDLSEYCREVKAALNYYDLELNEMEDVEPLSERLSKFQVDRDLLVLSANINKSGDVRFGQFHIFEGSSEFVVGKS